MSTPNFYPVIDCSDDGIDKVALFPAKQASKLGENQTLFLEEYSAKHFQLHSKKPMAMKDYLSLKIRCPYCGSVLEPVAPHLDDYDLAYYRCPSCR